MIFNIPQEYKNGMGTYIITNLINNKKIIGSTINFKNSIVKQKESLRKTLDKKGKYTRTMSKEWKDNITQSNKEHKNKKVIQIDKNTGEQLAIYESIQDAQKQFNPNCSGHIGCVCNNSPIYKTANGFKWRFLSEK